MVVQLFLGKGKGAEGFKTPAFQWDLSFLSSMPTFLLAYGCQTSFVPSMNTAKNKNHAMKVAV